MISDILLIEEISSQWKIVDCLPDAPEACGGSHVEIFSTNADGPMCPYDSIEPWRYCTGAIIPGTDGCTQYESDATAKFTCL